MVQAHPHMRPVLQGMGEPLSNYDAVKAAVQLMTDPRECAAHTWIVWISALMVLLSLYTSLPVLIMSCTSLFFVSLPERHVVSRYMQAAFQHNTVVLQVTSTVLANHHSGHHLSRTTMLLLLLLAYGTAWNHTAASTHCVVAAALHRCVWHQQATCNCLNSWCHTAHPRHG